MFRKILSAAAVVLAVFCTQADAQKLSTSQFERTAVTAAGTRNALTSHIQPGEDEMWWSYFDGKFNSDELRLLGLGDNTRVPMPYSACIRIPAGMPAAQGQTIAGVAFSFLNSKNISDVKIWISDSTPDSPEMATICCQKVDDVTGFENPADSVNEVRFDTPYMVDGSKDVYVGYSFVVNANEGKPDQYPVFIKGKKTDSGGLFLRFGGEGEWWYDYSSPQYDQYEFGNLALKVLFKGTSEDYAVGISHDFSDITAARNSETVIPLQFTNLGKKGFTSLELTVDVNGEKQNITVNPDEEITKDLDYELTVATPGEIGRMPVTITVDKVNGQPNACVYNKSEGNILVLSRIVPHKVVIEEFTGFWCGWCPKGIVAMEKARQIYGDDIVIVTVHHNDALECKDYASFTNQTVASYPQAHVDRAIMSVDPYYGSSLYKCFGIGLDIDSRAAQVPVAEVTADAELDGDILTAKSDVTFLYTGEAHYAVAFVLTENGMESDNWEQSNNLVQWKGQPIEELEPMFDEWINGSPKMKGVIFNDVAIGAKGLETGIPGSIPSYVTADEHNTYEVEFDFRKYKKILDNDQLNLCVFLFDTTTGQIVNADSKSLNPDTGIDSADTADELRETERYTADGQRIYTPQRGLNIVKYSDGSVKKIIVR